MVTLLEPFTPPDRIGRMVDPITAEVLPPRFTTTDEQEAAAVRWALTQMEAQGIYTVAVPVRWTRREPTTLTIAGHPEHLGTRIIAVFDQVTDEHDERGTPVDRSDALRFARTQQELEDAWETDDGLE